MIKRIKITIPKITFDVDVEIDNEKNKEEIQKKKKDDFYFVTLHNDMKDRSLRYVTLLTLHDCLTVPVYTLTKVKKSDITEDTILGFNNVISAARIVFGDKDVEKVIAKLKSDRYKILRLTNCKLDIIQLSTRKCLYTLDPLIPNQEKENV